MKILQSLFCIVALVVLALIFVAGESPPIKVATITNNLQRDAVQKTVAAPTVERVVLAETERTSTINNHATTAKRSRFDFKTADRRAYVETVIFDIDKPPNDNQQRGFVDTGTVLRL